MSVNHRHELLANLNALAEYRDSDLHNLMLRTLESLSDVYRCEWTELSLAQFEERKGAARQVDALIRSMTQKKPTLPVF